MRCCSSSSSTRQVQRPQPAQHATTLAHVLRVQLIQQQQLPQQQQLTLPLPGRLCRAAAAAIAAAALLCSSSSSAHAAPVETNWGVKCAGCHVAGGNIIQAGATLFQEDLVKNGYSDSDSLYQLLYSGKGRMPGFGTDCAPKLQCTFGPRLSDEELRELVRYVQDQAAAGWKPQQ